jgi:acyl-coenzyme A thioesterase PaaI-like protein
LARVGGALRFRADQPAFYVAARGCREGHARILFDIDPSVFHAGGAAHGTIYFKMLDDAAFYAQHAGHRPFPADNLLQPVVLTPGARGRVTAEGRWVSGRRRVLVAEARLIDEDGEEVGRGTGTFMRSHIALSSLPGYGG